MFLLFFFLFVPVLHLISSLQYWLLISHIESCPHIILTSYSPSLLHTAGVTSQKSQRAELQLKENELNCQKWSYWPAIEFLLPFSYTFTKHTHTCCSITRLKASLAGATGYWQLLKAVTRGWGCTPSKPVHSVKYSTFQGWLAPVPPFLQTWLAQINAALRSTSQPITHSKQITYWGGLYARRHFCRIPSASPGCTSNRG